MQQNTELRERVVSILNRHQFETIYRRQVFIRAYNVQLLARLTQCGGLSLEMECHPLWDLCEGNLGGGLFTGGPEGYVK